MFVYIPPHVYIYIYREVNLSILYVLGCDKLACRYFNRFIYIYLASFVYMVQYIHLHVYIYIDIHSFLSVVTYY